MMTKEQFTDILLTLANKDAYGAASLGYLPQMMFNKWLLDNRKFADHHLNIMWGFREENGVVTDGPSPGHLDMPLLDAHLNPLRPHLAPFGKDDDKEGLFHGLADDLTVLQYRKLCSRFDEVKDHVTTVLMSLDLSENSISRADVAAGLDAYLEEMLDAGGSEITLAATVPEQMAARIVTENWAEDFRGYYGSYDPFCRFGSLFSAVAAPFSGRARAPVGDVAAMSWLYPEITQIRMGLRGLKANMCPVSPVSSPCLDHDGAMRTYDLVVSDISAIDSPESSSAFQLDIRKRYQTYCPDAETLNPDTALLTALGSMSKCNAHAVIITGRGRLRRPMPLFSYMETGALKSFLVQDTLEAVIDVSVREPEKAVQRRHGRFLGRPFVRRIYIFTAEKSGDRKGTIQFISVRADNEGRSLVETVASAYRTFASIPGISAIVPLSKVLENPRQLLNPAAHTAVFEEPEAPDTAALLRDLKRLEERRIALTKDIADLAQSLSRRS